MRHRMRGRQLSRDSEHRIALRRNMAQSLFEHGQIRTTLPKAQELKPFAEKLITLARENTLHHRRQVISLLQDRRLVDENQDPIEEGPTRTVVQKLFNEIGPGFVDRPGGYTRIIKTADYRIGDGGSIVILQLVSKETDAPRGNIRKPLGLRRRRNERREKYAASVLKRDRTPVAPTGEGSAPAAATRGDAPDANV